MTGQRAIIELRQHGKMPAECWVVLHAEPRRFYDDWHPEMLMENDMAPEVHVMPDENVATLDFRFLRGGVVHIAGGDKARAMATLERIAQFEPAKAIAAGADWMIGWKADRGFVNFLQRKAVVA